MNASEIMPWVSIANGLLSLGTVIYVFLTAGSRDNTTAIKKVDERVLDLEQKFARMETDMRHMPSKDGIQRMEITLAEMNGKIAVLSERLQPVAAISERLQEFMLERAK